MHGVVNLFDVIPPSAREICFWRMPVTELAPVCYQLCGVALGSWLGSISKPYDCLARTKRRFGPSKPPACFPLRVTSTFAPITLTGRLPCGSSEGETTKAKAFGLSPIFHRK